nr:C39 family peptidase [uncultured Oscillibacter sp.]
MNKKPASYKQGDPRWGRKPYRVPGETSTIGSAGCGPTCAAMVIATLKDKRVTPETTCAWSVAHGYKALKQGTYYSYFRPQMAAYGIECRQLLGSRIINQPSHPIHEQVREYLRQGYWVVALMGPGTWTTGGHFVLVWDWDNKVRILDPASSAEKRLNGDPAAFRREVRCYWLVDARDYNNEEDDMNIDKMTDAELVKLAERMQAALAKQPVSARLSPELEEAKARGITDGTRPNAFCTRAQAAVMTLRAAKT